ncbi:MAG: adenylate/guanylate cyclase domain-containing protein [Pseudomonadota bacterium]
MTTAPPPAGRPTLLENVIFRRKLKPHNRSELFMNNDTTTLDAGFKVSHSGQLRLIHAENAGLRLAVLCRTAAAMAGFIWYAIAVSFTNQEFRGWTFIAFATFVSIGLAHLSVIGTRFDQWWMKYLLYAVDIISICALFVIVPVSRADDVPQIIAFRAYGIYYVFPVIALAALSLSWRLVLWSGIVVVAGWWGAFLWVVSTMDNTLSWADIPADATLNDYQTIFLSIDFIGRGNRIEETGLLFIAAVVLSVVVYRARRLFFAQINAEEKRQKEQLERQRITDAFGQYVPEIVVNQLVRTGGKLPPRQTHGVVMVLDIAGFSSYLTQQQPDVAIRQVDAFLSEAADLIGKSNGTVISYTGDGLLASFNAPLEIEKPELAAANATVSLAGVAKNHDFEIRIGIAAGDVISGSIGSKSRMAFTIYGEAVNRAARCETLCKELGQTVLMDERFARAISADSDIVSVGLHELRGFLNPEHLFTFAPPAMK